MRNREIVGLPTTVYPVDEWALVETAYAPEFMGRTETIFSVANGYVGMRGNPDEGRPFSDRGTFVNGFHETWPIHHAEEAFGFAQTGQTIVPVPDARRFHLYVDDEPLHLPNADLEFYDRRLDFRDGALIRRLRWRTPSGKLVQLLSRRIVSMTHRHAVGIRYELELLEGDAPIIISSQLRHEVDGGTATDDNFDPRQSTSMGDVLVPEDQSADGMRSVLQYRVANSGMTLACAIDHTFTCTADVEVESQADPRRGKTVFRLDATQGTRLVIDKFAAFFTSNSAAPRTLADRCNRTLDRVMDAGFDEFAADQRAWFLDFWDTADIEVRGNPVVQQAVRWSLFQLIQASARADGKGVPAKGLTGSGYEGHYFWDTEIYLMPFLTWNQPDVARNLLRHRAKMLDHARQRAREVNQAGALYPWRTINGEEASAYYEAGTAQYHINADVAYALQRYVKVTGDEDFLLRHGAEMLVETARLWADLGFHAADGSGFHLHGVTGPDEYTTLVNDNAYTNLMARMNLSWAAEVCRWTRAEHPHHWDHLCHATAVTTAEIESWKAAAAAMHVPHDDELGITPQDAHFLTKEVWDFDGVPREKYPLLLHFHPLVIYRYQVIKQADVVLAMFLLPDAFDDDLARRNYAYYDPLTTGDSSLSAAIQSIVAARLGDLQTALEHFRFGLYVDLADVAGNTDDGIHVAAAGGVWMTLAHGFGGLREVDGHLRFDPRLPSGWDGLSFPLTVRGSRLRVDVSRFEVTYVHEAGEDEIPLTHAGADHVLPVGGKLTFGLTVPA